jgi:hypothetical protein
VLRYYLQGGLPELVPAEQLGPNEQEGGIFIGDTPSMYLFARDVFKFLLLQTGEDVEASILWQGRPSIGVTPL